MNSDKFGNIPDKPFHSSSYAEVANGGSIGSTNSQTFNQRYRADQNRRAIRKYRDSYVGQGALRDQAQTKPAVSNPLRRSAPGIPVRQGRNGSVSVYAPGQSAVPPVAPRPSFKEPPARGFNPYG